MTLPALDLKAVAASCGGMILDALLFSTLDLKGIASSVVGKQTQIALKNPQGKSALDLKGIAASGKNSWFLTSLNTHSQSLQPMSKLIRIFASTETQR